MIYWHPTITLGQLREQLKDLPDDTLVCGEFAEEFKYNELGEVNILPAGQYVVKDDDESPRVVQMPPAVILFGGQVVNHEYALNVRYDQYLERDTS